MIEFVGFPKIPRYSRECIITEKIDGTNAQIYIAEDCKPIHLLYLSPPLGDRDIAVPFLVGSRSRWLLAEKGQDNHGFARWAYKNAEELLKLGPGRHFGEWWGQGINRGYGLKEKRFSLFNTHRWGDDSVRPACCHVVPILAVGPFETEFIFDTLDFLGRDGSRAAPGFMNPEGIVIYHVAGNLLFKKTILNDEKPKQGEQQ